MDNDRYARQRLIAGWDQQRVSKARVLVAGAGALGNEVLKNLALLGVGAVLVVDFDSVEFSNLSRTVLFDESLVGCPKAEAAAKALPRLNPQVNVRALVANLLYDVGLGFYRHCDLVIGCLDNLQARSHVGRSCALAGTPYLDGGIWSLGGEVRWLAAGDGPCFDCTLGPDDWERADQRQSCTGFRQEAEAAHEVPTVASTAAIIGGLLAQEAVKWICGFPVTIGKVLVYNGQALTLHRAEIARNPDCRSSHEPYDQVIELSSRATDLSARQVFGAVRNRTGPQDPLVLELGRDFLCQLTCSECGCREAINRVLTRVPESEQTCPRCGAGRRPDLVRSVQQDSPLADRPLADLGVPPGEVLAVHSAAGLWLYELTGDIEPQDQGDAL